MPAQRLLDRVGIEGGAVIPLQEKGSAVLGRRCPGARRFRFLPHDGRLSAAGGIGSEVAHGNEFALFGAISASLRGSAQPLRNTLDAKEEIILLKSCRIYGVTAGGIFAWAKRGRVLPKTGFPSLAVKFAPDIVCNQ